MKSPENDKWLDEALSNVIGSKGTQTDFEQWKQKHPQAVKMLTSRAHRKASASPSPLTTRRIIMKSPITKLAAAAVMIIASLAGLFLLRSTGSGIALAEVLERIEQVTAHRCQMSATFKSQDMDEKQISQATLLTSNAFGAKTIIDISHPITGQSMLQEIYILPPQNTITTLLPNEKKYSQLEFDEAAFDSWRQQNDTRTMIKKILEFEHTSLGRSTIDGVEVEGFQTTDPDGPMGQAETRIWVDVETKFPVRMEVRKTVGNETYMCMTFHDFQWDVPVDAAQFKPVIPDDYTPGRPMMQMLPGKKANSE